jgi:hypothetical protein
MVAATAVVAVRLSQQGVVVARLAVGAELMLVARPLRVAQESALLLVVECWWVVLAVQEVFEFQVKALEVEGVRRV